MDYAKLADMVRGKLERQWAHNDSEPMTAVKLIALTFPEAISVDDALLEAAQLRDAAKEALGWLKPGPCGAHHCEGCRCEMQLATDVLAAALRGER